MSSIIYTNEWKLLHHESTTWLLYSYIKDFPDIRIFLDAYRDNTFSLYIIGSKKDSLQELIDAFAIHKFPIARLEEVKNEIDVFLNRWQELQAFL